MDNKATQQCNFSPCLYDLNVLTGQKMQLTGWDDDMRNAICADTKFT